MDGLDAPGRTGLLLLLSVGWLRGGYHYYCYLLPEVLIVSSSLCGHDDVSFAMERNIRSLKRRKELKIMKDGEETKIDYHRIIVFALMHSHAMLI